jgi:hypothetical protein
VVTYQNVPEWGQTTQNSFQIEMFFDGAIRLTFLDMAAWTEWLGCRRVRASPTITSIAT